MSILTYYISLFSLFIGWFLILWSSYYLTIVFKLAMMLRSSPSYLELTELPIILNPLSY